MKRSEIRGRPPRIALRSMRATEESEATLDPGSRRTARHPEARALPFDGSGLSW